MKKLPEEIMECTLETLDDSHQIIMGVGLYSTGVFAVGLNVWLLLALLRSPALRSRSYFLVLNLCVVSLARNLLVGFPFIGTSALSQRWVFGDSYCKVFGFMSQFIGVYHMESLTHLCIERYITAKYIKFGWEIKTSNYVICVALCWFFSVVYTAPYMAGIGCPSCGAWPEIPAGTRGIEAWTETYGLAFALLGGVKPVLVMAWMLWQARKIEHQLYTLERHEEQLQLTTSVARAAAATLACWVPCGALVAWLLLPRLLAGAAAPPPTLLVLLAALSSEMATSMPALIYLWNNPKIQNAMWSTVSVTREEKNK